MKTAIIVATMSIGLVYGGLAAFRNQNPYYPIPDQYDISLADLEKAWRWEPSALWLPSYLLCKCPPHGFGITNSKSGYLFRSQGNRTIYRVGSTVLGGLMGFLVGASVAFPRRKAKDVSNHRATVS